MPSAGSDVPSGSAGRVHAAPPGGSGDDPSTDATEGDAGAAGVPPAPGAPGAPDASAPSPEPSGPRHRTAPAVPTPPGGTAVSDGVVGKHSAGPPPEPTKLDMLRSEWWLMVALVAGGLLTAALWRVLTPRVADSGNPLEADVAVDGTLAALGVVGGVVTAACVLLRPGFHPVRRALVAIVFSLVAGAVSWQVGDRLGTPHLRAEGVALVWPIITSAGLFAGSLLPGLSRRLED
jgi:hypothetical protein